jgi:hypothetical protein
MRNFHQLAIYSCESQHQDVALKIKETDERKRRKEIEKIKRVGEAERRRWRLTSPASS